MKQNLLDNIGILLLKKGYTIKSLTRSCFDILARKEAQILLIKALEDANSVNSQFTDEMKKLCSCINASPLIIAENAGQKLENNVIYIRFGIFTFNLATFRNALENELPFIKSTHAGLAAQLSGAKLRKIREEKGLSMNYVSKNIGVSRKMIENYEKGQTDITINKAIKLHKLFGADVFQKVDIFKNIGEKHEAATSDIGRKYADLGFEATETKKLPFDIIAKKAKELVLTEIGEKTSPHLKPMSQLLDADKLVIFRKKKPKGIPAVTKKEFLDFEKAEELIKFLKEY